jgi:hypothetical protein
VTRVTAPETRRIVAELHKQIAAKSPEHAALVAAFEALPSLPPAWDPAEEAAARRAAWLEQAERLAGFRERGLTQVAAARRIGVCERTAKNYEAALKAGAHRD